MNFDKSSLFFSSNTPECIKLACCDYLNINPQNKLGNYLGIPILQDVSKYKVLVAIKEKIAKKLQGWKSSSLSIGGKEVSIKSIAYAIPTYSMSIFLFPKKWCKEVSMLIANFQCGDPNRDNKVHWKSQNVLTKLKLKGCLGFKDLQAFNLSSLGKLPWRCSNNPILYGLGF